ncbi:MAG: hypothetical protein JEZ07_02460 [Phycisphaerae bacterium]|nr:hypothetical protein [Phycisphaerae bacterium]
MNQRHEFPVNFSKAKVIPAAIGIFLLLILAIIASSLVNVSGSDVGIVEKKFGGGKLPSGRILAFNGENGIQAKTLAPGWHFFYWPWQYTVTKVPVTEIRQGEVGILQASDGMSLPEDTIFAPEWTKPDDMINAEYFLGEGKGYKGPQLTVLKPGKYRLNTKLFTVKSAKVIDVKTGSAAVIKSNVGESVKAQDRLVKEGQRGIWDTALGEGQYYRNTDAYEVTMVSIRQVKVSYTSDKEAGELTDSNQPDRPITVRSKDGFTFPVDVRVTYRIDVNDTPKVVATVGDDDLVLSKLVTPAVRAIFRNNAEKVKALEYVQNRSVQESQSAKMLDEELLEYGVTVLAVRIGNIGDEESLGTLLKTQTDREIALQEQETFQEQQRAAEKEKELMKTTQEAEEEKLLATAEYGVTIAEEIKKKMIIDAEAQAEKIELTAEAQAKAYKLVSEVIGSDNAALIEIMKLIAESEIRITPDVMVGGSSQTGMSDALMGTILSGKLGNGEKETTAPKINK